MCIVFQACPLFVLVRLSKVAPSKITLQRILKNKIAWKNKNPTTLPSNCVDLFWPAWTTPRCRDCSSRQTVATTSPPTNLSPRPCCRFAGVISDSVLIFWGSVGSHASFFPLDRLLSAAPVHYRSLFGPFQSTDWLRILINWEAFSQKKKPFVS
jgi:hypothetical protein